MLTERSIINFLIWLAGLIAAPYLVVSALYGNFIPALAVAGVLFLFFIFGIMRDKICLLPLEAGYFQGRLNFLPFALGMPDVCGIATVLYYVITYIALQRKVMKTGPLLFFIPLLLFISIVVYHEHNFGLRAFGGGREGAKGAIFLELSFLTYLCGVSVNTPAPIFFSRVPFYCIFIAIASAIPYTLSTYFPSLAPYLLLFTNNVNASAMAASVDDDTIVRNSAQAGVGAILLTYLMAYYPMHTWLRPQRWWMILVGLVCTWLVVMGGFRGALFSFAFTVMVAAWCHYSWRALILIPPMLFGVVVLTGVQDSHLVQLPASAQRTLSFLPGDWDPEVVGNASSSNEFRDRIKEVYIREDLKKSPLFGNGFSYDSDEFAAMNYLSLTQETPDGYYGTKIFVVGKMFHIGWISLYDSVGLVGSALFLIFAGNIMWVTGQGIWGRGVLRDSPFFNLKIWIMCNSLPPLITYFTVYGDIKLTLPGYIYFAILLTHLLRLEKNGYIPTAEPARELSFDPTRGEVPVGV